VFQSRRASRIPKYFPPNLHLYMSRTIKIVLALFVVAVLYKVAFGGSEDVEVDYEPAE